MHEIMRPAGRSIPQMDKRLLLPLVPPPSMSLQGHRVPGRISGLCGTYLVRQADSPNGKVQYVFKARVEEAVQIYSSPITMPTMAAASSTFGEGIMSPVKNGVIVGDAVLKESAAYMIDHGRWAGVPLTRTVQATVKLDGGAVHDLGSLQTYVEHESTSEDIGCSLFETDNVHRIGLLDCRIFNLDRHEGNLLVQRRTGMSKSSRLVPIDHGFSMPSWTDVSDAHFCWQSWRQTNEPFSLETKQYIQQLTPFDDIKPLIGLGIKQDCVLTYVLCTLLVKQCVASHNLVLADIGRIMQRDFLNPERPSVMEGMIDRAAQNSAFEGFNTRDRGRRSWNKHLVQPFIKAFEHELDLFIAEWDHQDVPEDNNYEPWTGCGGFEL